MLLSANINSLCSPAGPFPFYYSARASSSATAAVKHECVIECVLKYIKIQKYYCH